VLATRTMVGEMERAAATLLRPHLQPGQLSVGVRVEVEHTAPTPVGARVVTRARYLGTEGKLHLFEVDAFDPGGRIGQGRHARAIVDEARLLAGAANRHA
jgi:fluoroacetyl-CoA thioesterase